MIQCVVCEDWYHSLHLNGKIPPADAYAEMICGDCMRKNDFLYDYSGLAVALVESDESKSNVNIEDEPEQTSKKIKLSGDACIRPKRDDLPGTRETATFWKEDWRKELCKCAECIKMYDSLKVEYLIDLEDTSIYYEEKGKGKEVPSSYMASLEALSTLPRVNQIDAISSYNTMKEKLFEFLQVTNRLSDRLERTSKWAKNTEEYIRVLAYFPGNPNFPYVYLKSI